MERKPDWLPGFPVQIYCNRRDNNMMDHKFIGLDVDDMIFGKDDREISQR